MIITRKRKPSRSKPTTPRLKSYFSFFYWRLCDVVPSELMPRKPNTRWIGPICTTDVKSDGILIVEDFHKIKTFTVHAQRHQPCLTQLPGAPVDRNILRHADYLDFSIKLINAFTDLLLNDGDYKRPVSRLGWNSPDDRTWEPAKNLKQGVPGMVVTFLYLS